jgi:hypothetical protein
MQERWKESARARGGGGQVQIEKKAGLGGQTPELGQEIGESGTRNYSSSLLKHRKRPETDEETPLETCFLKPDGFGSLYIQSSEFPPVFSDMRPLEH